MTADERDHFVSAYTQILLATWSSQAFADDLAADPRLAIAQFGLDLPDDARIDLQRHIRPEHGDPSIEVAVDAWDEGARTGVYRLYVPSTPQLRMAEIDDDELALLSAGYSASQCCCTPCCSCA